MALHVEGWWQAVWEAASDAFALSDPAGIVLAANPAYYELYGVAPEGVIGQSFAVIFPEPERPAAESRYRAVFAGPAGPPLFEAIVRRPNGTERIVESRISFIEAAGQRLAMLSSVRDVTVEVMARRDALRAEEDRRAFLSSLSHDIKSPISVIMGHAQVLRRHVARQGNAPSLERLTASLSTIESSAARVADLVDELVEVARVSSGDAPPLQVAPMDLVALAQAVLAKHQRLSERHRLVLQTSADSLAGEWDPARLERMLDNLLSNAIKYSPNGGMVTISVGTGDQPEAELGASHARSANVDRADLVSGAVLRVQDRGIGIAAADLPYIFERFRRGTHAAVRVPGSGVGLASVREIVEQHRGSVSIQSREGEGTAVSVWLPLQPPLAADQPES